MRAVDFTRYPGGHGRPTPSRALCLPQIAVGARGGRPLFYGRVDVACTRASIRYAASSSLQRASVKGGRLAVERTGESGQRRVASGTCTSGGPDRRSTGQSASVLGWMQGVSAQSLRRLFHPACCRISSASRSPRQHPTFRTSRPSYHTPLFLHVPPRAGLAAYISNPPRPPSLTHASFHPPPAPFAPPLCQAACDPGKAQPVLPPNPVRRATSRCLRLTQLVVCLKTSRPAWGLRRPLRYPTLLRDHVPKQPPSIHAAAPAAAAADRRARDFPSRPGCATQSAGRLCCRSPAGRQSYASPRQPSEQTTSTDTG